MSSEKEQLNSQLAIKDTDKTVAVGEYTRQLEEALTTNTQQATELGELRALKAKMELVKKHDAGSLLPILDQIPYLEDEEAMETVFTNFLKWGDDIAKKREGELLAGYTPPGPGPIEPGDPAKPDTKEAWLSHIQQQGNKVETDKAWQDYWDWGQTQT